MTKNQMPEGTVYFDYARRTERTYHTKTWRQRLAAWMRGRK